MEDSMMDIKEETEDEDDLILMYYGSDDDDNTNMSDELKKLIKDPTATTKSHGEYRCRICRYKTKMRNHLRNHYKTHLPPYVKKYTCHLCKKTFQSNEELIEHKHEHEKDVRSFICKICKLAFTEHCDWLVHEVKHLLRTLYRCRECGQHFAQKSIYSSHIPEHYYPRHPCKLCSKVFKSERVLKMHMEIHSDKSVCGECGKNCKTGRYLTYHMASHTGVRRHQCLYCGKGFFNKSQAAVHTRIHTNERPFQCEHCERRFKQSTDMQRHTCKVKTQEKKYQCDICKKMFRHKESIIFHLRIHTNDRPFACKQCNHACITASALKWHISNRHSNLQKLKCDVPGCGFTTHYASHVNRHKRQVHKIK